MVVLAVGMRSLARMLWTCFATAPSVTQPGDAGVGAALCSQRSTSRSRGVSSSSGSSRRRGATSPCISAGSTTEPPLRPAAPCRRCRPVHHPALEQIPSPLPVLEEAHRLLDLDVGREHQDPHLGVLGPDFLCRVEPFRRCVGGMRMSIITRFGRVLVARPMRSRLAHLSDDVEARALKQAGKPFAKQHVVVGDDDPSRGRAAHLGSIRDAGVDTPATGHGTEGGDGHDSRRC